MFVMSHIDFVAVMTFMAVGEYVFLHIRPPIFLDKFFMCFGKALVSRKWVVMI